YRPVHLLVVPKANVGVHIDAWPDNAGGAQFSASASFISHEQEAVVELRIIEQETGRAVQLSVTNGMHQFMGAARAMSFTGSWENARYWHFDHPHLYSLEATLVSTNGTVLHRVSRTFG